MIRSINHIGLSTANLDQALSFYKDLIGMELLIINNQFGNEKIETITGVKGADGRVALLKLGDVMLEIFEFTTPAVAPRDPNPPVCNHGINHLCFEVSDIEQEYERFIQAGVTFHCEPLDFPSSKATYGRDPDGNAFELREPK